MTTPYDKYSRISLLNHARKLLGESLRGLYPDVQPYSSGGKGGLGQTVEVSHFGYEPNSDQEPDFKEVGVELKCTPLYRLQDGSMVSKERLVLTIIDYQKEAFVKFEDSVFWHKSKLMLLMFYLYENDKSFLDYIFRIVRYWEFPEEDLKIIENDWAVIHEKIVSGRAHEISEGDTLFLGACTKGSKGQANKRIQYNDGRLADQRAYSLKSAYMNSIIFDSLFHPEMCALLYISERQLRSWRRKYSFRGNAQNAVNLSDYQEGETFEQVIERKFSRYYGKSIAEIEEALGVSIGQGKAMNYNLCRAILGVKTAKIAEFEKADLQLKTISLNPNGVLKESMSFRNVYYCDIVNEEWEESYWYGTISKRFLFVVFRKSEDGIKKHAVLERVIFWTMPVKDYPYAESLWIDTREKVSRGDYGHFIRSSENPICHIRPKGEDSSDLMQTPQGTFEKKMCYWLNRQYILSEILHQ
jgi:DNA mismatch repair protein MutH